MAIPHASPGQVIDVRPLRERLSAARPFALFKSRDLEVIRLVLKAGQKFPPHKVPGDVTIHCLEGSLHVHHEGALTSLHAGEMLYLPGNVAHEVSAVQDASALVTIAIQGVRGPVAENVGR